jgi:hypothetical protein
MAEELTPGQKRLEDEQKTLADQFKDLQDNVSELKSEFSKSRTAMSEMTRSIGLLKSPLLSHTTSILQSVAMYKQQIGLKQQEINVTKTQIQQIQTAIKAEQANIDAAYDKVRSINAQATILEGQEAQAQERGNEIYEEILLLGEKNKLLQSEIDKMSSDIPEQEALAKEKLQASRSEIQRLKDIAAMPITNAERGIIDPSLANMTKAGVQRHIASLEEAANAQESELAELSRQAQVLEQSNNLQEQITAKEAERAEWYNQAFSIYEKRLDLEIQAKDQLEKASKLEDRSQEIIKQKQKEEKKYTQQLEKQQKEMSQAKWRLVSDVLIKVSVAIDEMVASVRKTQQAFGVAAGQALKLNIGTEIQSALSFFSLSARVSGEEIRGAISAFQQEFGGVITPEAAKDIAVQAKDLGVTTQQLAVARRQFMTATMGNVGAAAAQQDKFISEFQKKGLTSKDALDAIAQNSEIFARNGTRFAASFARAAADAKKIGVDLGKIDQIGDNIIGDFEGFLEKTAELGAMGFGFDSQRMAEVAESGDTGALMNELRSQLAAQGKDLTNLRRSEQLALSQAFGVPMAELQRLAQTQTDGSGEQLTAQEKATTFLSRLVNLVEKFSLVLAGIATLIGGVISSSVVSTAINTARIAAGGMFGGAKGFAKNMFGLGGTGSAGAATAGSVGGVAMGGALPGGGMMMGAGAGLKGMAEGFKAFANPQVAIGVALLTAGLIGVGFALKLAAPGIEAIGTVIKEVLGGVAGIITSVGGVLVGMFSQLKEMSPMQLIALGGSLYVMSGGLMALGLTGLGASVGIGLAAFAVGRLVSKAGAMSLLAESAGKLATNLNALSNVNTAQLKEVRNALPTAATAIQTAAVASATTPKPTTPAAETPQPKIDFSSLEKKLDGVVTAIGRMRVELDGHKVGRVIATNASTTSQVGVFSTS